MKVEDFFTRLRVLATSAISGLSLVLAVLVSLAAELNKIEGVPSWLVQGVASAIAFVGVVIFQVRRVTPVLEAQKGLLPPKGPGVGVAGERPGEVDRGEIQVGKLFLVVALVLFILIGLAGSGWIIEGHKELLWALLGWGGAFWIAASLVP